MAKFSFRNLWRGIKARSLDEALLPFDLVKYFSFASFVIILLAAFALSWLLASNARTALLQRSEAYSQLFADNLNRQVFVQFVLPIVVRYGRISLSNQNQYERLDLIVKNLVKGMRIDAVTIYDSQENIVAYSTIPKLMGKHDLGGLEYSKAAKGKKNSVVISGGSLLNLLPGTSDIYCTMKTYVPFRQENRLAEQTSTIIGVIEVEQDLSADLHSIVVLQGKVILLSLGIMSLLFALLSMIVVKANRIMARRAAEQIRLEEELHEARRLASLGKMVASVSHEIKNPLGIVRSTAEILAGRISKLAPGNERLAGIIVEETTRLDRIVREFLDFARPRELQTQPGSINSLAERVLHFLDGEFVRTKINVYTDFGTDMPELHMDTEQMYQVVLNIVFNAIQAMPQGGSLSLRSAFDPDSLEVSLSVADTGPGIAPDSLEQIFTPFYTEKNRGTGLGLAIARSIVEKHRGHISVNSELQVGSCFTITLPLSPLSIEEAPAIGVNE